MRSDSLIARDRRIAIKRALGSLATNAIGIAGLAGFTFGAYQWSQPAGWACGGLCLVLVAILIESERRA